MSEDTAKKSCLKSKSTCTMFCSKSGPVSNDVLRDAPWKLAIPFSTIRTLPGLSGEKPDGVVVTTLVPSNFRPYKHP